MSRTSEISSTNFFLQIAIIAMVFFYIFHSNRIATSWYALKDLQQERENIVLNEEILNLKISRAQSLDSIEWDPYIAQMVDYPEDVVYIDPSEKLASID